ncbi:MAG: dTDP-4-dehydrorhamnose 3,5-epimerase family protein [Victivallales bacterium]|jgi:dTDP-4-dehydrorhamnose 3,5-epimerase|nr:dTDP-4-dehydrorhamnose 3,5-epimerase family protein [Victivallales bacterium]
MRIESLPLAGAAVVHAEPREDARGRFARLFCQEELRELNGGRAIQQVNLSLTRQAGAIRGLHFQRAPKAEDKAVRCLRGRVLDVLVDLRRGSVTFGQWCGVELSAATMNMVYIPRGFAHGFQTLEPDCEMLYLHTEFYSPEHEGGIRFDSPGLGIRWPLPISGISPRDQALPVFRTNCEGTAL